MARPSHPDKDIEKALKYAEAHGWRIEVGGAHAWGAWPPVHEGSTVLWHLADVLAWLESKGIYKLAPELMEVSKTARQINIAKEALQLAPAMKRDVQALIAG